LDRFRVLDQFRLYRIFIIGIKDNLPAYLVQRVLCNDNGGFVQQAASGQKRYCDIPGGKADQWSPQSGRSKE
jgi:hypothetical protein